MTLRQRFKYWLYGYCPGFAGAFTYFGTKIYFPPGADIFLAVCQQGVFERDLIHLLTSLAEPGTLVFDVGGNIGLMAVPVLSQRPDCRVVSFEPSPSSLPFLQRTVGESRYGERWTVVAKALAQRSGEVDFVVGDARTSLYEGFKSGERLDNTRTIKVVVSTLDEEWRRLGKPAVSVVKIDVEGAEGLVMEGAREMLRDGRPHILVEWYDHFLASFGTPPEQLLSIANELNYRIYTIPAGIPVDDVRTLRVQMPICSNFLLVP